MSTTTTERKTFYATRILVVGLVLGAACMVALFVAGLATATPGMVVAASTGFAGLAASFTTAFVVVRTQRRRGEAVAA